MNRPSTIALVVLAVALIITALSATFVVSQREQALVVQLGEPKRAVLEPGLNFKIPFIQKVYYFEKRILNFDAPSQEAPTLDQKQVVVEAYAKYRVIDPLVFFRTVTNETGAAIRLGPIINSTLRAALGEIPMSLILTAQRADFMREITQKVNQSSGGFGIEVLDVRMKRIDLPEENSQAIFRRMQTQREQEARRIRAEGGRDAQAIKADADKKQVVIIADARRQSSILHGDGDAEATRIYNEAFGRDPAFFDFFRSMQALTEGLPGDTTSFVGPPTGDFFRYFGNEAGSGPAAAPAPSAQ